MVIENEVDIVGEWDDALEFGVQQTDQIRPGKYM